MNAVLLSLLLPALLAGCAAPAPVDADRESGHLVHSVQRDGANVFEPASLTVAAGVTVTWDVVGPGHHTVTFHTSPAGAGEPPDSGDLGPGQTFAQTFPQAGTYRYWCRYHSDGTSGMAGTVVVG